jgi:hypothetical protein
LGSSCANARRSSKVLMLCTRDERVEAETAERGGGVVSNVVRVGVGS